MRQFDLPAVCHAAFVNSIVALLLTAVSPCRAGQGETHEEEWNENIDPHCDDGAKLQMFEAVVELGERRTERSR